MAVGRSQPEALFVPEALHGIDPVGVHRCPNSTKIGPQGNKTVKRVR